MVVPRPRFLLPLLIGCGLCAASSPAFAQGPRPPLGATPAPLPPSLPSMPTPAGNPQPAVTPVERPTISVTWNQADIIDILHYYEGLSGKHILYDNTVQARITIDVREVTRTDMMRIIETALNLNGFTLVSGDNNIIKCVGLGKPVRPVGVPIYADLASLPDSEEVVTFMLRLSYLDAQETAGVLTQYIPPSSSIAFTPLKSAGALLLTDTARSVRRLVSLIRELDLPSSPVTEKFIALQRADAAKAVEFLNGVFETKASGGSPGTPGAIPGAAVPTNTRRPIRRIGEDGQPVDTAGLVNALASGSPVLSGDLIQGRITLTADVRTNRVHVVTSPANMPLVERLLMEYDADTPFALPASRALRYVKAKEVLPILVRSLQDFGEQNGSSGGATTPEGGRNNTSNRSNTNSNFGNSNSSSSGYGSSGSGSSSGVGQEELSTEPADTTPEEQSVGSTKIIADPRSNSIILLGAGDAKDKIDKVLDKLDVPSPQIVIRVVIGELSLDNNNEFGLQYLLRRSKGAVTNNLTSGFTNPTTGTTTGGTTTGTTTTDTTTSGGLGASTLGTLATLASGVPSGFAGVAGIISVTKGFDIILTALESTSRFKTINQPVLYTSNNERAVIINGQEIAVPVSTLSTAVSGTSTTGTAALQSNVEFKKVALQLEVVPLINSHNEVKMQIVQKLDSLVAGGNVTVGGNSIPTIANREIKSTVTVLSGSTVVLGGLITQNESRTSGNVPVLSKIPLLGELFKARTHDATRSELIILLHPQVLPSLTALERARMDEEGRLYMGGNLEDQIRRTEVRKATPVRLQVKAASPK